jgi:hypothetical protein
MKRLNAIVFGFLASVTISAAGCSLCCSPYTDDYVAFGSKIPRVDMKHGRVGSILSDPEAMTTIQSSQTGLAYDESFDGDSSAGGNTGPISLGSDSARP